MNSSIYRISLDIHCTESGVCLNAKLGDTTRAIMITLTDGGVPYRISEGCYAVFTAIKPDGAKLYNECTIEGSTIIYKMTGQTTNVVGEAKCEVRLYGVDNELITSPRFSIIVEDTVYHDDDIIDSSDEFTALTEMVTRGNELLNGYETAMEQMEDIRDATVQASENAQASAVAASESAQSASASAASASASASSASESSQSAADSAFHALNSADSARLSQQAAADSETAAKESEDNARDFEQRASEAAREAIEAAERAQSSSDHIDLGQLEAKIASKADDLFFDNGTSLLYLMSEGQIIGSGVKVATVNGSGGGESALMYTISLNNLLDSRVITVAEGKDVALRFSYSSVDAEGYDDGPGIGRIIVNNATRHTFAAKQGENTVDITDFLSAGSNTVKLQVENTEETKKTVSYTVTVVVAHLTSSFDTSIPYTGEIPFTYTPTGIADKTIHFELDGEEIGTAEVTSSGREQSYPIPAQSHGSHSLRVWFECKIEGVSVTSNTISMAIICTEAGNNTPIIAVTRDVLTSVEQYSNLVTKYRVYDPANLSAAITLEMNGEVVQNLTVDRTEQTWVYRPVEEGELVQTIRCGEEFVSWTQTVTKSSVQVEASDVALALHLSSYGRSNSEANPGVWEYENIGAEFHNFNYVSDGWKMDEQDNSVLRITGNARLVIPYKIFAYDFRTTGKTIEFELATRDVLVYDAEVINCFADGRGFSITAQQLKLASEQSVMISRYKEDEHLRVTFVVEKKSGNRLVLCYINGIMSGAASYPENDDFSQLNPVGITIGSNFCTTDLYNIRVYDNDLTRYQVLDNWIADTQDGQEKLARFLRNQIYDAYGRVMIQNLPGDLSYMVLQCSELPQYKGDKKTCSGYFVDMTNPGRSFSFENAEIDVQGTSSQYYYVKNYKIKFKNGFISNKGTVNEDFQMNEDAVPVSTFTMKADVASSEGAFNVVLAMLYDDLCPYKTPAQQEDPKIRQTIEGFPMVMFWDDGRETIFLGKYNFNNDKGTEEVFGFQSGDESWEILQNGTDRVGWHSADFSGDGWKQDFEARYPDKNTDITRLRQLAQWLVSTDTAQATGASIAPVTYGDVEYTRDTAEYRLAKFSAELSDHFVEEAIIFYYLFTEIFLSIDQREKNAFPTYLKDEDRWIVLFYDADSSCGTDNKGNLTFDYYLEDIDYTEGGDPIYNGQNSVLWRNLRETRHNEIAQMYNDLRISGEISYEAVIGRFEAHQSKWPEAIFNEDMYRKCLEPLIKDGDGTYLPMLQGKKEQWMKWWLYNRFRYLDSKYVIGESMSNRLLIRAKGKANVHLTSYVNMYGHVFYNAAQVDQRMDRNVEYEFVWPASGAEDAVVGINDADLMVSLGDLAPLMVEEIDVSGAAHLTDLKLGDKAEDYANYALTSVTLGNNILLRKVDLRNCKNLTQEVNLSGCTNIEEVYLDGTAVTGVRLPNGGIMRVLHLPETITNLTVRNHKYLTDIVMTDYSKITTLWLENNGDAFNPLDIVLAMPDNSRARIIGFNYEFNSGGEVVAFIGRLNTMRGLDEEGNNVPLAQVSGSIHVDTVTFRHLEIINQAMIDYPSLKITYDEVRNYIVRFYNEDGTLLRTVNDVTHGSAVAYTGNTPTKPGADNPTDWLFIGWSPDPGYITDDTDCVAQYAHMTKARKLVARTLNGDYTNDRVTSIGDYAFAISKQLVSVSFPKVTTVGERAFNECGNLTSANFPLMESAGNSAFINCARLADVTMPNLKTAAYGAFSGTIITEIPTGITELGDLAMAKTKLTRVSLPSIIKMGHSVFLQCTTLEHIDFGPDLVDANASLAGVRKELFNGCSALTTVIFRSTTILKMENVNAFTGTPIENGTGYIYVPSALVDSYKAATNWSTYAAQIRAIEDYPEICGGEV